MNLTPILIRHRKMLAPPVTLLVMAGIAFTRDVPLVSPPLTMRPGTTLTVRINEPLSSDHNQVGDVFSATLTQPVIVLGIVVARYGQTVAGQIVEAKTSAERDVAAVAGTTGLGAATGVAASSGKGAANGAGVGAAAGIIGVADERLSDGCWDRGAADVPNYCPGDD